jgi:hypothetical protein
MKFVAATLLSLAAIVFGGCRHGSVAASPPPAGIAPLSPSPHLIVGRVLAVDREKQFAIVDVQSDAPPAALRAGAELIARGYENLVPTARLRASAHLRGRTLGTTILSGQPSPGDEVVWLAP